MNILQWLLVVAEEWQSTERNKLSEYSLNKVCALTLHYIIISIMRNTTYS